jgi:hypothetical protein
MDPIANNPCSATRGAAAERPISVRETTDSAELNAKRSGTHALTEDTHSQTFGAGLRALGSDGIAYPSVRQSGGECAGLFYPDRASLPIQGRHLDYHWNGACVDLYRDIAAKQIYRVNRSNE